MKTGYCNRKVQRKNEREVVVVLKDTKAGRAEPLALLTFSFPPSSALNVTFAHPHLNHYCTRYPQGAQVLVHNENFLSSDQDTDNVPDTTDDTRGIVSDAINKLAYLFNAAASEREGFSHGILQLFAITKAAQDLLHNAEDEHDVGDPDGNGEVTVNI